MHDARAAYIETQILTATPQKLRLMLIEGCMRFARQARQAHAASDIEQFSTSMDRARDIVTELISGIRPGSHPMSDSARAIYAFIFKSISEAQLFKDVNKIDDALRVLEEERQTWSQLCETTIELPAAEEGNAFRQQEILASPHQIAAATTSFSLDA